MQLGFTTLLCLAIASCHARVLTRVERTPALTRIENKPALKPLSSSESPYGLSVSEEKQTPQPASLEMLSRVSDANVDRRRRSLREYPARNDHQYHVRLLSPTHVGQEETVDEIGPITRRLIPQNLAERIAAERERDPEHSLLVSPDSEQHYIVPHSLGTERGHEVTLMHERDPEVPLRHERDSEVPLTHERDPEISLMHERDHEVPLMHERDHEVPLLHERDHEDASNMRDVDESEHDMAHHFIRFHHDDDNREQDNADFDVLKKYHHDDLAMRDDAAMHDDAAVHDEDKDRESDEHDEHAESDDNAETDDHAEHDDSDDHDDRSEHKDFDDHEELDESDESDVQEESDDHNEPDTDGK